MLGRKKPAKDVDLIIQCYIQNLNKQRRVDPKKEKIKLIILLALCFFFLFGFIFYQLGIKVDSDKYSNVDSTIKTIEPDIAYEKYHVKKTPFHVDKVKIPLKIIKKQKAQESNPVKRKPDKYSEILKLLKTPVVRKDDESKTVKKILEEKKTDKESQPSKLSDIILEKIEICENVENLKPVGILDTFSTRRVYCWIRLIAEQVPYKIHLTFFHEGRWIYRYTSLVKRKKAVTWCYKTIWDSGKWEVEITDDNKRLLGSKTFLYENQSQIVP